MHTRWKQNESKKVSQELPAEDDDAHFWAL